MDYHLVSLDYQARSCNTTESRLPMTVGRSRNCEMHLDDPSVSPYHCVIERIDGTVIVRNLGSGRGTFVNGTMIAESELTHGDELCIGMLTFLVRGVRGRHSQQPGESELPPVATYAAVG